LFLTPTLYEGEGTETGEAKEKKSELENYKSLLTTAIFNLQSEI